MAMNFRLTRNATRTYVGPEFFDCHGSARPVLHAFKVRASTVGNTGTSDATVFFVGTTIPERMDSEMRIAFVREIYRRGNRKIRTFGQRAGFDKEVTVYYSRKAAVDAFDKLVSVRRAENKVAKREPSEVSVLLDSFFERA
jgi:hypothetical protein